MELRDYMAVVKRRKWLILATVGVVTGIAVGITAMRASTYTATTSLRVATPASLANAGVLGTTDYLDRLQNTYSNLATSATVRDALVQRLHLRARPKLSVGLKPNTELMNLSATAGSAGAAAAAANLGATLLIQKVRQLGAEGIKASDADFQKQMSALQRQIAADRAESDELLARGVTSTADRAKLADLRTDIEVKTVAAGQLQSAYQSNRASLLDRSNLLSVVAPAVQPSGPSGPNVKLAMVLGLIVGLIAGLGLAFLFENLSTRMEATEEIERTSGLPVLGTIPVAASAAGAPLFNSGSPAEEAFRRLRTNVLAVRRDGDGPQKIVLVTSPEPHEGKSTITANLAASLAQAGQKVVVVDADLRVPTLHRIFKIENEVGFGDVLQGRAILSKALCHPEAMPGLAVLPSGGPFDHPAEVLASPATEEVLVELSKQFDVVLVDTPALLSVADALSLAASVPNVLVVVSRNRTRREALVSVQKQLTGVGARPLGVVVNRAEAVPSHYHYHKRR
jgi:polysaccharide biosynthesis transport protein